MGKARYPVDTSSRSSRTLCDLLLHFICENVLPLVQPPAVLYRPGFVFALRAQSHFRMQGPVRVVERLAADRNQVGLAALQNLLRMLRVEDQADRHGFDSGFLFDAFRERDL